MSTANDSDRSRIAAKLYEPLKVWETRLIRILPGEQGDPLFVDLKICVITLADGFGILDDIRNVTYEALSYTWGDPIFDHAITCNGNTFHITANLYEALEVLRRTDDVRWLWADALCINQFDIDEKAIQIQNMFRIYQKAQNVLVYLGPSQPGVGLAMDLCTAFASLPKVYWNGSRRQTRDSMEEHFSEVLEPVLTTAKHNGDIKDAVKLATDACQYLLSRPWIFRAWVMQEVGASESIRVICGSHTMSWSGMAALSKVSLTLLWKSHEMGLTDGPSPLEDEPLWHNDANYQVGVLRDSHTCTSTYEAELIGSDTTRDPIHGLRLILSQITPPNIKASVPLDKIYALLNIVNMPTTPLPGYPPYYIPINYNTTVVAVRVRMFKIFMNSNYHPYLELFRYDNICHLVRPDTPIDTIPSWLQWISCRVQPEPSKHIDSHSCWVTQDADDGAAFTFRGAPVGRIRDLARTAVGRQWCSIAHGEPETLALESLRRKSDSYRIQRLPEGREDEYRRFRHVITPSEHEIDQLKELVDEERVYVLLDQGAQDGDLLVASLWWGWLLRRDFATSSPEALRYKVVDVFHMISLKAKNGLLRTTPLVVELEEVLLASPSEQSIYTLV